MDQHGDLPFSLHIINHLSSLIIIIIIIIIAVGVAHKIEPGSSKEAQAIKEEEDMQFLLNGGNNVHRKLLGPKKKGGLAAFMEANGDGDEGDEDDEDNGRKSSAQEWLTTMGRKYSAVRSIVILIHLSVIIRISTILNEVV